MTQSRHRTSATKAEQLMAFDWVSGGDAANYRALPSGS